MRRSQPCLIRRVSWSNRLNGFTIDPRLVRWIRPREAGVPAPSEAADGQVSVAVPTAVAAKLALDSAMKAQRITTVELADRLGVSESAVRKLTNPDYRSHMSQVQKAPRAVGRSLKVEITAA